jgi:hypothetical protein
MPGGGRHHQPGLWVMRNPSGPHPQCTANRARASAAGTSRCRVDARELQPLHAQNFPSRAPQVNNATAAATVPNGGYRVMAPPSGRHVARLLFQSASVLIADSARFLHRIGRADCKRRTSVLGGRGTGCRVRRFADDAGRGLRAEPLRRSAISRFDVASASGRRSGAIALTTRSVASAFRRQVSCVNGRVRVAAGGQVKVSIPW